MSPFSHRTLLLARLSTLCLAISSLVLYIIILHKVFAPYFASEERGLSALPAIGLAVSIAWNLGACGLLIAHVKTPRILCLVCDVVAVVLVGALGTVGFVHDDRVYFRTGRWTGNTVGGKWWLDVEIASIVLLYIAV